MIRKVIVWVLVVGGGMGGRGECGGVNDGMKGGERVCYEVKFKWKLVWINGGWGKMRVKERSYKGGGCLKRELEW